jgi:hypothetical protein
MAFCEPQPFMSAAAAKKKKLLFHRRRTPNLLRRPLSGWGCWAFE